MATGMRELRLWQEAVLLAGDVVRAVRQHSRRETIAVTNVIALNALGIADTVADAYARYRAPEQRERFLEARIALARLETEIAVARQATLFSANTATALTARVTTVVRLLSTYLTHLERQLADAPPAQTSTLRPIPADLAGLVDR